mmetsp:Transcript_11751/g.26218  ORF Transcript_11751/g.26218 Transcript_11751/m.26218 type:complete len:432 (+) Transcript_11751:53-1348(+)
MSFRDLENGPRGGHASKQQPKQRREDDSPYERTIKANIQEMQDSVRMAGEQLERAQRSFLSRRMADTLEKFLGRSRDLSQETEQLFRDWTVHLAGEPTERHRKKFSYEKLQKAFYEEILHLKEVARKAVVTQQEVLDSSSPTAPSAPLECSPVCDEQGAAESGDDEERGLLNASMQAQCQQSVEEDIGMRQRISQEREEGIRRIQNQVLEVNQIFRDLASIVQEHDKHLDSIEYQAEKTAVSAREATKELRKSVDRQRGTRERLCCMLAAAVLLLGFVLLPHVLSVSDVPRRVDLRHPSEDRTGGDQRIVRGDSVALTRSDSPSASVRPAITAGTLQEPVSGSEPVSSTGGLEGSAAGVAEQAARPPAQDATAEPAEPEEAAAKSLTEDVADQSPDPFQDVADRSPEPFQDVADRGSGPFQVVRRTGHSVS